MQWGDMHRDCVRTNGQLEIPGKPPPGKEDLSKKVRPVMALLQRSVEADVGKFVVSMAFSRERLSQWPASLLLQVRKYPRDITN